MIVKILSEHELGEKMKVNLVSDLHLERGEAELPGGELLIIAGDACEARQLRSLVNSPRPKNETARNPILKFFEIECAKYKQVLYLPGNHEHYGGVFEDTVGILQESVPDNVQVLDQGHVVINNTVFVLATLWTDMNAGDPVSALRVRNYMNDFSLIKTRSGGRFTTDRAVAEFEKSRDYISSIAQQYSDRNIVVCTHHAPSDLSTGPQFKHLYHENAGFRSNLEDFILARPNIKVWCHGHMHNASDYQIAECRVICNPRGYIGYDSSASGFRADFGFEID